MRKEDDFCIFSGSFFETSMIFWIFEWSEEDSIILQQISFKYFRNLLGKIYTFVIYSN